MAVSSHRSAGVGLERALHHWRERGALLPQHPGQPEPEPMTVAISRECGAGGAAVAAAVGESLGWPVYDRQLVDSIAEDSGVRAQLLECLDEKRPNWFTIGSSSFSSLEKTLSGVGYAMRLRDVLVGLAGHGQCVIVGRGAAQLLSPETTLRLRLIAPRPYRIARVAQQLAINEDDAARWIDHMDKGRNAFVKSYFKRDAGDPSGYDLTIDTSRFALAACAEMAIVALRAMQQRQVEEISRNYEATLRK